MDERWGWGWDDVTDHMAIILHRPHDHDITKFWKKGFFNFITKKYI